MTESIPPCRVLGVFGMSMFTRRDDLEKVFSEYGAIDRVEIISNRQVRVFDFSTILILKFIKKTVNQTINFFLIDWKIKRFRFRLL